MRVLLNIIGLLGAGLAGALAARHLFTEDTPAPARGADATRIEARLDDIEVQVARLAEEFRRAPALPPPPAPAPAPANSAGEAAAPPGAAAPEPTPGLIPEAEIEAKVRATVEEMARVDRETRARQAAALQAEQEAQWLAGKKVELGLTDWQVEELLKMLVRRREVIAEYQRKVAELGAAITPAESEALKQGLADYGRALDQELRTLLSAEQYEGLKARNTGGGSSSGGAGK